MNYFKLLSRAEGISLLVLLFIAMPAKYQFGISEAVLYAGITHGSLFLAYVAGSLAVSHHQNWSILRWLSIFLAGVIPFCFLLVDNKLQLWHTEESPAFT